MSAIVALTAQNTLGVTAVHELPPEFVQAQLDAVFSDLGVDAAKTGMLFSRAIIETVARFLSEHPVPLVVDPVMVASSGAKLLEDDAVEVLVGELFPLATVVTPNLLEAKALTGVDAPRRELAERLHELGAPAVIVTGGHGQRAVDHVSDGERVLAVSNGHELLATVTGTGCMSSALTGCFLAAKPGEPLEAAAEALAAFGVAAEDAAAGAQGPGTFHARLYDALYALDRGSLDARGRIEQL